MSQCGSVWKGYHCQYAADHPGRHRCRGVEWEHEDDEKKSPWKHIINDLPKHQKDAFERIGKLIAERERTDPLTFKCRSCCDHGYIPGREIVRGSVAYETVEVCPHCDIGRAIMIRRDCPKCGTGESDRICSSCLRKQKQNARSKPRDDEPPI